VKTVFPRRDMTVSPATNFHKEKKMRKILCASALTLILCGSAMAGDMGCPPIDTGDPTNPPSASQSTNVQTDYGSTNAEASALTAATTAGDADVLASAALSAFNSLLTLL